MSLVLITPPDDDVVSLDEVKAHLLCEGNDQDDYIQSLIAAAVSGLDPASGGSLGRALRPQVWELQLYSLPAGGVELAYPPLISVISFTYRDASGIDRSLTEGVGFKVVGIGTNGKQYIAPIGAWPALQGGDGAARVRFKCGYDTGDDRLPAGIKSYIKLVVDDLFRNRGASTPDALNVNPNLHFLLDPHRVF